MKITNINGVIEEIIELRCKQGYSSLSLVTHLKEKYGLQHSRAYELVRDARAKMGEIYDEMNKDVLKQSIMFMEEQVQKLIKAGDNKTALAYQKELNKVNQLYVERQEIKITGDLNVRSLFGFEEEKGEDENDKDKS